MNRTAFVTATSPKSMLGSRVQFNDKAITFFRNNLDPKTFKRISTMRGEIIKTYVNRCLIKWDVPMFNFPETHELLRDLEDEKA